MQGLEVAMSTLLFDSHARQNGWTWDSHPSTHHLNALMPDGGGLCQRARELVRFRFRTATHFINIIPGRDEHEKHSS